MTQTLAIDVWSDIACPWCWVGKRQLEQALEKFDGEVDITWRSYELNPQAPLEPKGPIDYADRLARKYSVQREEAEGFITGMVEAGRSVGLDLRFDRIRPSNTFKSHRLLLWARQFQRQQELGEKLFSAYLHEGKSLNDEQTLVDAAESVGLDRRDARSVLESEAHGPDVRLEQVQAQRLGVTGVPFFLVAHKLGVAGAQPADVLLQAMHKCKA